MRVSLIVNGIAMPQRSMAEGLAALKLLLQDRRNAGCTVTPTDAAAFGVQYRILHPGSGTELVCLSDFPEDTDVDA
jgi:hypothetical protein